MKNHTINYPHSSLTKLITVLTTYMNIADYNRAEEIVKRSNNHGHFYGQPKFNFPIRHRGNKTCGECDATGTEYHKAGCKTAVELIP